MFYKIEGKFHSGNTPFMLLVKANLNSNPELDDVIAIAESKGFSFEEVKHFNEGQEISEYDFNYYTDNQAVNIETYVAYINQDDGGFYPIS